jgi:hypothetical protein
MYAVFEYLIKRKGKEKVGLLIHRWIQHMNNWGKKIEVNCLSKTNI